MQLLCQYSNQHNNTFRTSNIIRNVPNFCIMVHLTETIMEHIINDKNIQKGAGRMEKDKLLRVSWHRSSSYGVDPAYVEDTVLSDKQLKERKERLSSLFTACTQVLSDLYFQLRKSLFMVLVSDVDGYIVFSKGDPPFVTRAKKVWLQSGANWSERVKGTNAIGTALFENKPIHIIGREHFSHSNHFLTCYAAPLYDARGKLLGVLDVSGDAHLHHPRTFGMVMAAAEVCQTRLLLQNPGRELILHIRKSEMIVNPYEGAFIAVNEDGFVTRMNQSAARIFEESEGKCIGQHLSSWFIKEHVNKILSGKQYDVFKVKMKQNETLWTVEAIKDNRKRTYRSVLTLPTNPQLSKQASFADKKSIWHCPKAYKTLQLARNIAPTNASVYIRGETGTGKEVIAREIHFASRRTGPLVTVNCGAIPESLIESELFGYEKGAFTGANKQGQRGKFRDADKGTLFLDEIGEMSFSSQVVLLRVLEEKRITPIGSHRSIPIDVRIIAATNRNLVKDINNNQFRADLYYRLCEIELTLLPLREREDLLDLSHHFLKEIASEVNVNQFILSDTVQKQMKAYHWPGNIRELRHTLRQAAYQAYFQQNTTVIRSEHMRFLTGIAQQTTTLHDEEATIEQAILQANGNLSKAAKSIGIGRTTLYRKLNNYPRLKKIRQEFNQK